MKIYRLDWNWYDDGVTLLFSTEIERTESQFFYDCSLAFQAAGLKLMESSAKHLDMHDWTLLAGEEMLKLGYDRYEPVSLAISGDAMFIKDEAVIDVDIWPEQKISTEEFLGVENCNRLKERILKTELEYRESMKEFYEKGGGDKEDKEVTNVD